MNYQEYLQMQTQKMMEMFKATNRLGSITAKLNENPELTDEETRMKLVNAHVAMSFLWGGLVKSEEQFNQFMEDIKDLPKLLGAPSKEGTVLDLVAKTDEEKVAFTNEVNPVYAMFHPEIAKVADPNAIAAEKNHPEPQPAPAPAEEANPAADFVVVDEEAVPDLSAQQYIKQVQSKVKNNKKATLDDIAEVLAVRAFTYAERKNPSNLQNTTVTYDADAYGPNFLGKKDIRDFAAKVKNNAILSTILTYPKNQKAVRDALTSGNAGALDDYVKKAFLEYPIGSYPNDPAFARYMPTVKDRIEFLQDKFGKSKSKDETALAAAEILVMRNMIKAERDNKKSLNVRLSGEQLKTYSDRVTQLANDPQFIALVNEPDNKKALVSGHGGDFIEKIRISQAKKEAAGGVFSDNLKKELKENTLQGQLEQCASDARSKLAELNTELDRLGKNENGKKDMSKTWDLINEAKDLTAKYLATRVMITKYGNSELIRGMTKDVPWSKQNEKLSKIKESEQYNNLTGKISPDKTREILGNISTEADELVQQTANSLKPAAKNTGLEQQINADDVQPLQPN